MKRFYLLSLFIHLVIVSLWVHETEEWSWTSRGALAPIWISESLAPQSKVPRRPISSPQRVIQTRGSIELPIPTLGEASIPPTRAADANLWGNERPTYPKIALERGWEGRVLLRLRQGLDSNEVVLVESSGYGDLDEAAIRAARGWRIPRGSDIAWVVPIDFRLKK